MRSITLAGIILVTLVVVAVNLLAGPQTLDTSQMQTMYGGVCYNQIGCRHLKLFTYMDLFFQ